jgi:DNA-binding MarR family transcriptional regulator
MLRNLRFGITGRWFLGNPAETRLGRIFEGKVPKGRGHGIAALDLEEDMELNERVMILIVMASEMFKKKSSAILRRYGLTFSHYSVLKDLVACEHGRDTAGNVSKRMLVTPANLTGLAKRMEKAALIERQNGIRDERLTMLQITPKGRKLLDAVRDIQEQHGSVYLETCSHEQKEEVLAVLRHVVRAGKGLARSNFDNSDEIAISWQSKGGMRFHGNKTKDDACR